MSLYIVATPIGNLQDISPRVLKTLESVDLIACEDTRHTLKLLNHHGIKNRLVSYHEHNEHERTDQLMTELRAGRSVAMVSDAGTPGICDPGFRIVDAARRAGIEVVPIPGPVAFVSGLVASGLATDSVFFGGFLPSRRSERLRRLESIREIPATLIFYETPHRLARALADCEAVLGNRRACVARELTKLHESIVDGTIRELAERFATGPVKGEIVLVIARPESDAIVLRSDATSLAERVAELEAEGADPKAALKQAAKEFGLGKSEAYRELKIKT
jgi:16S rRNA (cytidine1402-2'-O)-methyltransferase